MPVFYQQDGLFDAYQRWVVSTWIEPLTEGLVLTATRGHSLPADQLKTVAKYAVLNKIAFPEFSADDVVGRVKTDIEGHVVEAYRWYRTIVELWRLGVVINPPLAVPVPFDYRSHKRGDIIQASPHIKMMPKTDTVDEGKLVPAPIDFTQVVNKKSSCLQIGIEMRTHVERVDIKAVADICDQAKLNGAPLRAVIVETANGCVHLDLGRAA